MSETQGGPDWQQGSDAKWYAPPLDLSGTDNLLPDKDRDLLDDDRPYEGPSSTPAHRGWRRSVVGVAAIAALVVLASVLAAVVGSTPNADAAIINAVKSAIGSKTALIDMNEHVTVGGQSIALSGTGTMDFTDNAFQISLGGVISGQQVVVDAIYLGGSAYESVPGIAQVAPGKSWLSLDVASLTQSAPSTGAGALGNDPLATLQTLAQQGATVVDLGPSTVDGQSVEGYSVTFNPTTLEHQIQGAKLPTWMQKAVAQMAIKSTSEKVYINGTTLVQVSMAMALNKGTTEQISLNEALDFSDYGTPVTISAPSADEVIPLSQFVQLATAANLSSTS